ncbi:hypothetical protein B0H14DRAFT_2899425 [Mycena olivaceomarginata]|nr:hypothetical protein B0H14DRAFT_2899425 [Mycena olivaceomarginata]
MIIWLLPASLSFAAILERNPTKQTAVVADCVLDRFMKLRCVPGGMDVILAFAIFGILPTWRSPPTPPHPANLYPLKFYPPGSEVPVWMLAHMADVEQDEEAGAERAVGLV